MNKKVVVVEETNPIAGILDLQPSSVLLLHIAFTASWMEIATVLIRPDTATSHKAYGALPHGQHQHLLTPPHAISCKASDEEGR